MNDHFERNDQQLKAQQSSMGSFQDLVTAIDDTVMADSRKIAEKFGKRHGDVLRAIRNLDCSTDFKERNFAPFKNKDLTGESTSNVLMTRDGFTFLAMGFTGKKAASWKEQFITAFNMMEQKLRSPQPVLDPSDPKVLLACFEHLKGQVAEKEAVIAEQGQRLEKLDRIEGAEGNQCITDVAKLLKVRPKDLFAFMSVRRWIYKRPGKSRWIPHQDKMPHYMDTKDHLYIDSFGQERLSQLAVVTPKGLVKLAELLEQPLH